MSLNRDPALYSRARSAVESLARHYRQGAYRIIRDPDGIISLWAIVGSPSAPFSVTFVHKGRVYTRIEDVPPEFLVSFLEYSQKLR